MRIREPDQQSAAGRLTAGILTEVNAVTPLRVNAREFNAGAEQYYRTTLRRRHIQEGLQYLQQECSQLEREPDQPLRSALRVVLQGQDAGRFVAGATDDVLSEQANVATLKRLMNLLLLTVHQGRVSSAQVCENQRSAQDDSASVYRTG
jgi:hypothetical protein